MKVIWIGFYTLLKHEVRRFIRVWRESLLPPLIMTALYFTIFGTLIGSQVKPIHHFNYMQYMMPGLVIMSVITNSYLNTVTSVYLLRFQRAIEEILVSPLPDILMMCGFVFGGVIRGVIIGGLVMLLSLFYTHLVILHWGLMLLTMILTAVLFSMAGFLNGILAKSFDDVSIVPTFVLTPLTYLGGVFYSVSMLPGVWQKISYFNPILYLVNLFRYSLLGVSDISVSLGLVIIISMIAVLLGINHTLLRKGVGMRT